MGGWRMLALKCSITNNKLPKKPTMSSWHMMHVCVHMVRYSCHAFCLSVFHVFLSRFSLPFIQTHDWVKLHVAQKRLVLIFSDSDKDSLVYLIFTSGTYHDCELLSDFTTKWRHVYVHLCVCEYIHINTYMDIHTTRIHPTCPQICGRKFTKCWQDLLIVVMQRALSCNGHYLRFVC